MTFPALSDLLFVFGSHLRTYERSGRISKFPAVWFGKGKGRGRVEGVEMKGVGSWWSRQTCQLHISFAWDGALRELTGTGSAVTCKIGVHHGIGN